MQGKSRKWFAMVETWLRQSLLYLSKRVKSACEILIIFNGDGHGLLNVQEPGIPRSWCTGKHLVERRAAIPSTPEGGDTLAA
jgi:hypothetical protein